VSPLPHPRPSALSAVPPSPIRAHPRYPRCLPFPIRAHPRYPRCLLFFPFVGCPLSFLAEPRRELKSLYREVRGDMLEMSHVEGVNLGTASFPCRLCMKSVKE
jgi:hypothetical protein